MLLLFYNITNKRATKSMIHLFYDAAHSLHSAARLVCRRMRTSQCTFSLLPQVSARDRLAIFFRQEGNDQMADECAEWVRQMTIWHQHEYKAELDSLSRITP
jgi:hypothetical protein